MNKIVYILTTIVIAFSLGCYLLIYQYPRKQLDFECLSENHNNEEGFSIREKDKVPIILGLLYIDGGRKYGNGVKVRYGTADPKHNAHHFL